MRVKLYLSFTLTTCCFVACSCARQSTGTIEGTFLGSSSEAMRTYEVFVMRGLPESIDAMQTVTVIDAETTERYGGGAEFCFKIHRRDGKFTIDNLPTGDLTLFCMSDGLCGWTVIHDLRRNEHRKDVQVSLDSSLMCDKWRVITDKTLPEHFEDLY